MNCRDALRLLYDVVDKEATESDISQVQEHLKTCRHCSMRYDLEAKFKECIERKGNFSPDCEELRTKITQELDSIDDAAGEVGTFRPPFRWIAVSMAAAAAIILCIVAAGALSDFHRFQTEFAPFFRTHQVHAASTAHHDLQSDPFDFLYQHTGIRLDLPPQISPDDIHTVMIDTIKGIPFGCIQLAGADGDIISIFVASKDRYTLPSGPCETLRGSKMLVTCCEKCNLVGCEKGDLIVMAVASKLHEPEQLAELTSYF